MFKLRVLSLAALAVMIIFVFTNINTAQDSGAGLQYIGNKKCKTCHSSEKKGGQFKQWEDTKHAKAYAVLASPEAKAIGKEKGIEDPQKDPKCLKCHVTAYGVDAKLLGEGYKMEDGVGCESCHGPGEKYNNMKVMNDLSKGSVDPAAVGLIIPKEATCTGCHNAESPTFKSFNFEEKLKLIAHPMPQEYKDSKGYK